MALYLVERYIPSTSRGRLAEDAARTTRVAREMTGTGTPVRHVWSTFLPSEEACLSLFEAPDPLAVEEVNRRAGLTFDRIVEAVSVLGL
ncbi:MAG TPA: nickel-binding protein [Actinomycetota bacterium]|nr:nickel-binding protein [Actinomycetota bacterium]